MFQNHEIFTNIFFSIYYFFSKRLSLCICRKGRLLYDDFCVRCHLPSGKGEIGIIPPLADSDFLYQHMEESIKALKFGGIEGEIIVNGVKYNSRMEKMGLYDDEIADVMNYILNSWGNKSDKIITKEFVKKLKK